MPGGSVSKKNDLAVRQLDLFVAQYRDVSLRDSRNSMEFPFFSVSKRRTDPIAHDHGGVQIHVSGQSDLGIATIWDLDFLIWCASQLNASLEKDEPAASTLRFIPYNFLSVTGRDTGGSGYREMIPMLNRLQGTQVRTNIPAAGKVFKGAFSWIKEWRAVEDDNGHAIAVEVELSEWFYWLIMKDRSVLSISADYFNLKGGMERWLYRIARKHCGQNDYWEFKAQTLYDKYPPGRVFRQFKAALKKIVEQDSLPEYHLFWIVTGTGRAKVEKVGIKPREHALEHRRLTKRTRGL